MLRQLHTRCTMYLLKILVPINLLYTGGQVTHKKFFLLTTTGNHQPRYSKNFYYNFYSFSSSVRMSHWTESLCSKKNFKQNTLRLVCKGWETIELVKTPRIALFSILVQNECSIEKWGPCLGVIYQLCRLTMEREEIHFIVGR